MQIKYKDIVIDVKKGTKVSEVLKEEIKNSDLKIIACKFNNEIKNLNFELYQDGEIELIDITDKDGIRIYTRGLMYIVSKAVHELYPKALITIDYQLYHSMFCRIDNLEITEEVIKNIEEKVQEIIDRDLPITRKTMSKEEAEEFYNKEKTIKGKLQLDLKSKNVVTLYYCEDYYNYFYGVLPISTGSICQYELKKYDDGILIRYPSRKTPEKVPEFKDFPKLFHTLKENEEMHRVLNVNTLYKLNNIIKANKVKDYILLDEALHEKKIVQIADDIKKSNNIRLVAIAGPSSSGKTTFSKRLEIELKINGLNSKTISVDNYFVEREQNPRRKDGKYDFECIEAIDTALLNRDLVKLLNGEEIKMPTFNFHTGHKEYLGNTMKLEKDEILVMEGIHCLNDKLTYLIPKEQKYKIYISALTVLNIDYYNRISTTDTRLIRRIVRDYKYRGYTAEHTLKMWPLVNLGEINNIFVFQEEADAMFNSSLIYELAVLKDYAMPLLKEIKNDSEVFSEAKRLYSILSYFESIESKYIPSNSLLREFIGGSIFEE